jgi:protein-S-isoprenylcysteine O-methyltransferase Ste14
MIEIVVATGWAAHLLHWSLALATAGRSAAQRTEWKREVAVRLTMLVGIMAAVTAGPADRVALPAAVTVIAAVLFLAGHLFAIAGRTTLGSAWSIGTRPRPGAELRRTGVYAAVRHPIYAGVFLALVMQLMLLQNVAALALLLGAIIIVPVKIAAEDRWLARHQGAGRMARRSSHD